MLKGSVHICKEYGSSSYMKVKGAKNIEDSAKSATIVCRWSFRLWRISWCDRHLSHV